MKGLAVRGEKGYNIFTVARKLAPSWHPHEKYH